jgi:hypothetical protein
MKSYIVALFLMMTLNALANANLPDAECMTEWTAAEVVTPEPVLAKIGPMVRATTWALPVLSFINVAVHDVFYDKQQISGATIGKWFLEDGVVMWMGLGRALHKEWFFGRIDEKFLHVTEMHKLSVIAGFFLNTMGALIMIPDNALDAVCWGVYHIYLGTAGALLYKTLEAIENPETQNLSPGLRTAHTLLAKLQMTALAGRAIKILHICFTQALPKRALRDSIFPAFLGLVALSLDIHYINQAVAFAEEHIGL